MGSLSPNQKFWLIGQNDLVNVEQDLNYNLERVDYRMRTLVEYMKTDVASITATSSMVKEPGMKWYKTFSNSIWYCHDNTGIYQDPNAQVDTWNTDITFESGFSSLDTSTNRIGYSIFGGLVRLRGKLIRTGLAAFTKNIATDVFTLPASARPDESRYFFVHMGEGLTQFQVARIFIPSSSSGDLRCECMIYGQDGQVSGNNYISLNDIYYPISD